MFSLSTGLETALADVVSQLVEESKSMVKDKQHNASAEDLWEEKMAKKLPCLSVTSDSSHETRWFLQESLQLNA